MSSLYIVFPRGKKIAESRMLTIISISTIKCCMKISSFLNWKNTYVPTATKVEGAFHEAEGGRRS
jgi:hypothetical protein